MTTPQLERLTQYCQRLRLYRVGAELPTLLEQAAKRDLTCSDFRKRHSLTLPTDRPSVSIDSLPRFGGTEGAWHRRPARPILGATVLENLPSRCCRRASGSFTLRLPQCPSQPVKSSQPGSARVVQRLPVGGAGSVFMQGGRDATARPKKSLPLKRAAVTVARSRSGLKMG